MKLLATILATAAVVSAHGYVDTAIIGGQNYQFYQPDRISRRVEGNGPIEDVSLIDLQCGGWTAGGISGSAPAKLHAPAAAGSQVTLKWTLWPDSHVGPTVTYMARCPASGYRAVWFKVHEQGLVNGVWGAAPLMVSGNSGYKFNIPQCLAPGYYLVRHELIALHAAFSYPGAQFYPSCFQLQVSGSGTANPTGLVSFPGAYTKTDPGVVYNSYIGQKTYPVPGPKVFTC
ncbi:cellulose-growth-specific protein [Verticillium alfalfae VaMs.102]|uniref:lytic cellulose monooxygenase (C4-dehydrogenating) n=1 Tax=Verticillium alfalfae (strain VaMs.102 / ATCC MYA-4576 / FGSC 10136) TaxID=526221 RepID=C9SJQ1_VERA1|nr:cellulose-growth-specific protein [Verticillium alfalfae VaMs.102]EEY19665.1 cellulose-growth-specific protein [Verticillium alfalfae VaMs.102]